MCMCVGGKRIIRDRIKLVDSTRNQLLHLFPSMKKKV